MICYTNILLRFFRFIYSKMNAFQLLVLLAWGKRDDLTNNAFSHLPPVFISVFPLNQRASQPVKPVSHQTARERKQHIMSIIFRNNKFSIQHVAQLSRSASAKCIYSGERDAAKLMFSILPHLWLVVGCMMHRHHKSCGGKLPRNNIWDYGCQKYYEKLN